MLIGRVGARLLAAALVGALAGHALAQTPDQQIPVYALELRKVPDIPEGQAALVAGNAGATPDRFFLEHLHMLRPVSVTVRAAEPGGVVTAKITKSKWDDVLREGTTGADSQVNFKFRTQGEFQISITSPSPGTPYKMVVWVGPDIAPTGKRVFVPESEFENRPRWLPWAIGGGAVAVVLIGLVLFMRRKRAS